MENRSAPPLPPLARIQPKGVGSARIPLHAKLDSEKGGPSLLTEFSAGVTFSRCILHDFPLALSVTARTRNAGSRGRTRISIAEGVIHE